MAWSTSDHKKAYATDGFLSIYAENGETVYGLDTVFLLKGESYTVTFTTRKVAGYHGTGPSDLYLTVYSSSSPSLFSANYNADGTYSGTFTPDEKVTYVKFHIISTVGTGTKWLVWDTSCAATITR